MRRRLVLSALALVQAGCSLIFVEGPPPRHRELPYFACSTSYATPVIDTAVGGLMAATALTDAKAEDSVRISRLVLAATLAASAVYGYTQVGRCDAASAELAARMYVPPPLVQPSPALPPPALPPPVAPPVPAPSESAVPAPSAPSESAVPAPPAPVPSDSSLAPPAVVEPAAQP